MSRNEEESKKSRLWSGQIPLILLASRLLIMKNREEIILCHDRSLYRRGFVAVPCRKNAKFASPIEKNYLTSSLGKVRIAGKAKSNNF